MLKTNTLGTKTAKIMLNHIEDKVGKIFGLLLLGLSCGCATTYLEEPNYDYNGAEYRYYVIDVNADIPDAYFLTYEEASTYQKEFAENHEYVIVKIDEGYNVYNMEITKNEN